MKDAILFLWQLPQNLLGLLFWAVLRNRELGNVNFDGRWYHIVPSFPGGIALGNFVFIKLGFLQWEGSWRHELGHTKQSRMLGWLYLPVVGLPSLLWAWWWKPTRGVSYYDFWTEKWADRLGGVER